MDFTLRELEIFTKVVELKGFSKAAERVFLAQASVSERVAVLEEKVGTRLLDRLGRKVIPTAAGKLLYEHAARLLTMKKNAQLELERFLGLEQGDIAMGGSTIPGEYILPGVISRFKRRCPGIVVNLAIGDSGRIEKQVLSGALEIGVIGYETSAPNLQCRKLWDDELVLAVPVRHPWAECESIAPKELLQEPFILREAGSGTLKILDAYLRSSGTCGTEALKIIARFGSSTAVKEGVKSGMGLSVLSARAVEADVKAGLLKAVKIEDLTLSRHFFVIRNQQRVASPACQVMLDFLLAEIRP